MTHHPSPAAKQAPCVHQPACPGCPRFGEIGVSGAAREALQAFCANAGCVPEWFAGQPFGYRGRARLAIRGSAELPQIGVFEKGSHAIVDIPQCSTHHPLVNRVAAACRRAANRTRTPPYSERSHSGLLRYIQIVRERRSELAQVTLVANAKAGALRPFLSEFQAELADDLHSLFVSENLERTNSILGRELHHISGPTATLETIGGAEVFFPPDAFGQANLDVFDEIVQAIHSWVSEPADGGAVVELYAGVGAIGLGLAARDIPITFNEIGAGSLRGLRMGLSRLTPEQSARCAVFPGGAGAAVSLLARAKTVIVDPPRKGLDAPVVLELCRLAALKQPVSLIYLSCGLSSFLRDSEQLLQHGFRLDACRGYALFPFTDHVETLARFTVTPR